MFYVRRSHCCVFACSAGLRAKPTLTIPPLTEGKEATLTCKAPDSCSGPQSNPEFTWIWVHPGENSSSIAGNKTEIQSSNSALIFNPSAEHHGTALSCQVTCSNRTSAEVTVTLNVTYVKKPEISGEASLVEGDALNLTCTAESFPPSVTKWTKQGINKTLSTETGPALIIHNVTVENAGQYSCAVEHPSSLTQDVKITVIIKKKLQITGEKDVTEGRSLNLTCSLDSLPPSFITWTKLGFNSTVTNGTGAATLFIPNTTAEHSGRYVCSTEHLNSTLTQEVDVQVKYVRKLKVCGRTTVKEGGTVNLTCTVDSFPPSIVMWTKHGNSLITQAGPDSGSSSLVIHNVTVEDSGLYFCTAHYLTALTQDVNISVIYRRSLKITGETVVTEGRVLQLACRVDSWPRAVITWTELRFNTTLQNGTGATSLIVYNVTAEHSGLYRCTAKHLDNTLMDEVDIKVKMLPQILKESVCEAQLDVLTCVCISQGLPLPTIKWLLSENQTEYSFHTAVSNHTVKSTLTVTHHSWRPAVCVSGNENGETKEILVIKQVDEEGRISKLFRTVTQLRTAVPFLAGTLLSALIFCLFMLCCRCLPRKKQQAKESTTETLEMIVCSLTLTNIICILHLQTNDGRVMEYEQIQAEGTAGAAEEAEAGGSDVEYSDIKLLMLKKNTSTGTKWKKQESEDTKCMYAKIKLKEKKTQANEDKEEEELRLDVQEVPEGEDVAVYSTVKEQIDQS
ncbi:sialic acid-binding Ig-like lectin 10 [Nematolebias whitei]|uniref:sialic acid-binding Ig-like lectin 10 n=1 Tax=Nematolebias whitei TaxID=451745 RepID=UPI00189C463A|nr:sialic acid-binding Ig-like lectin 10 [Nematolebias whitei]